MNMEIAKNFRQLGKKIVCVGRNYRDHAAELGNPVPKKPLLFFKPTSAYVTEGQPIKIPEGCKNFQHEIELAVVIGRSARSIDKNDAWNYVGGYALALDMTARDFQDEAKKSGSPWLLAKGFDTSCPVSGFISKERLIDPHNVDLWLKVNGELRQKGNTKDMIFDIPYVVSYASKSMTLEPGDLLLTGTPAGVSTLKAGDQIECGIGDVVAMRFSIEN